MNKVWSQTERDFIARNAGVITDVEGARQLSAISGRTISVHAWRKQRQKLGVKKAPGRGVCRLAGEVQASEPVVSPAPTVESKAPAESVPTMSTVVCTCESEGAPATEVKDGQDAGYHSDF